MLSVFPRNSIFAISEVLCKVCANHVFVINAHLFADMVCKVPWRAHHIKRHLLDGKMSGMSRLAGRTQRAASTNQLGGTATTTLHKCTTQWRRVVWRRGLWIWSWHLAIAAHAPQQGPLPSFKRQVGET